MALVSALCSVLATVPQCTREVCQVWLLGVLALCSVIAHQQACIDQAGCSIEGSVMRL